MAISWAMQRQPGGAGRVYPPPTRGWEQGTILLGNPTDRSIEIVIHPKMDGTGTIAYGTATLSERSPSFGLKAGKPSRITLNGLRPDTSYRYRLTIRNTESEAQSPEYRIQTQRAQGESFSFFVQGDSHPERNPKMNIPALYQRTLETAAEEQPDFFVCMGDDFSVDTLHERTAGTIEGVYRKQVPYLGLVAHSSPLFLVNGNHEQASKANYDGTAASLGVLVQNARNRNFAQPAPDGFYSGNPEELKHIGHLRNYFAWTWGDALFVVIDPYWHSEVAVDNAVGKGPRSDGGGKRNRDLWNVTLGERQYRWLTKTLEESQAKYKFVFAHHVHGTGRGGVENAPYFEWGGKGRDGADEFKAKRPGWALPIHQLFVKTGVTIFFQGHDHIFCRQELDGVIYQSTPVPADGSNELINGDAYRSGDKVVGAGLVRVGVSPEKVTVEFRRSFLPDAEKEGHRHGEVAHRYEVKPKGARSGK